jgi:hypothetical protein
LLGGAVDPPDAYKDTRHYSFDLISSNLLTDGILGGACLTTTRKLSWFIEYDSSVFESSRIFPEKINFTASASYLSLRSFAAIFSFIVFT